METQSISTDTKATLNPLFTFSTAALTNASDFPTPGRAIKAYISPRRGPPPDISKSMDKNPEVNLSILSSSFTISEKNWSICVKY